jgi:hypothetical protein
VKRSQCQLRVLKIYVRSNVAVQTIYLLHLLPSLTTVDLILAQADTGTAIFREFKSVDGRIILPHVESISVHCIHDDPLMLYAITDALQIRSESSDHWVRLNSFTLSMDGSQAPTAQIRQRWRMLSEKGMELRFENSRERWI